MVPCFRRRKQADNTRQHQSTVSRGAISCARRRSTDARAASGKWPTAMGTPSPSEADFSGDMAPNTPHGECDNDAPVLVVFCPPAPACGSAAPLAKEQDRRAWSCYSRSRVWENAALTSSRAELTHLVCVRTLPLPSVLACRLASGLRRVAIDKDALLIRDPNLSSAQALRYVSSPLDHWGLCIEMSTANTGAHARSENSTTVSRSP